MMIFENKVFLHLPKSAGTSVNRMIKKSTGFIHKVVHGRIVDIPEEYESFKTYAIVRNPIDWYKSILDYDITKNGMFIIPFLFSDNGTSDYITYINRCMNIKNTFISEPELLEKFCNILRRRPKKRWKVYWQDDLDNIDLDFFNRSLYQLFYDEIGVGKADVVYRMESDLDALHKEFNFNSDIIHINKGEIKYPIIECITEKSKYIIIDNHKSIFDKYYT